MTGRCDRHGIALSPDGVCVLCRRGKAPPARSTVSLVILSAIAVLFAGTLFFGVPAVLNRLDGARAPSVAPLRGARGPTVDAPEPAVAELERDRELGVEPAPVDEPSLAAMRGEVDITMYSTSWCGYCRAARRYLDEHDIHYVDRDIERDARARARMEAINPRGGVPTFEIDGEPLVGFSERGLSAAIDRAAARRL